MDGHFQDIAGLITDGSSPLKQEGLRAAVTAGANGASPTIISTEEYAVAGLGAIDEASAAPDPAAFLLAESTATGPFEQWEATKSISQFGEGGTGGWAALRGFPESQKIWLARDQFGQQPLYYAEKSGATAFSTRLDWFFKSGFMPVTFDAGRFGELVQLQFLAGGGTAYAGIRRVFPGETLVIERGRIVDRLRRPAVPLSDRKFSNRSAAIDTLDIILNETVDAALAAPGMIGCVITGDLASTVLAIAIARRAKRRVRAYVPMMVDGAKGKAALEGGVRFARGLGFEPVALAIDEDQFRQDLPGIISAMTDPVGDYAALIWNVVARAAKQDAATLVLPTGGQELFGAYGRYRTAARPLWLGGRAMRSRGHLQGLGSIADGPADWRDGLTGAENRLRGGNFSRVQALQLLDIGTWLPNDTLLGEHQIYDSHKVNVQRPFLDPALAGFAFSLSDHLKLSGKQGGVLLQHWIARTYPTADIYLEAARSSVPVGDWIGHMSPALGPVLDEALSGAGFMETGRTGAVLSEAAGKKTKRLGMAAWQLLYFALWYRIHISGAPSDGDILSALGAAA